MSTSYLCTAMTKTPGEHLEEEGFLSEHHLGVAGSWLIGTLSCNIVW